MNKTLSALAALLILGALTTAPALADSRGSMTISATFGNLAVYSPPVVHYQPQEVIYYPPQQVIVIKEPRYEKKGHHGKRHHYRDRHDCYTREERRRPRYQESAVVYHDPAYNDYRERRDYRY
jgi:hypothetical protein